MKLPLSGVQLKDLNYYIIFQHNIGYHELPQPL
jgi:hypothetical protein